MDGDEFGEGRKLAAWATVRQILQRITQGTRHCLRWNEVSSHTPKGGESVPTCMRACTPNDRLSAVIMANMTGIHISCATIGDDHAEGVPLRQLVIILPLGGQPYGITSTQVEGHWREIDDWRVKCLHEPDYVQRAVNAINGLVEEMSNMASLDDSAPRV